MDDQDTQPTEEKVEEKTEEPKAPQKARGAPKASQAPAKNLEKIIEEIEKLSVLELSDLVKALEEKFGVPQVVVAPSGQVPPSQPGIQPEEAKADEGQTIFNVVLTSAGANKIVVIKALRELIPTLGLKEAKDLVEAAPKEVLAQVNKVIAEEAKKKLTAAGAQVELK